MSRGLRSIIVTGAVCAVGSVLGADVAIVEQGVAKAVIVVDAAVMLPDQPLPATTPYVPRTAELDRRRLRESVLDLVHYIRQMSGAEVAVAEAAPADGRLPIYVGDKAVAEFGPVTVSDLAKQGWRLVVTPPRVGVLGESALGSSYAIYEILHRWGCRWYMPSEMGEHIPQQGTLTLAEVDLSKVPSTLYRGIWYADDAFKRRNRQGGLLLNAGHALEGYISKAQREAHPEWRATINGKPHANLLTWTRPEVREAIAEAVIDRLTATYAATVSLSPSDGAKWDEAYDPQFDADDLDPATGSVSKTDRLLVLCNEVVERVTAKFPEVLFGMLAYVDYTRPPVREKVHPHLVPQIAPITYNRAQPMTAADDPNGSVVKDLVEGWAIKAKYVSHYWYAYNLAEVSAPNPFITKWSVDLPIILASNCKFWQPETMANFETTMIGLYLGMRLSWDAGEQPEAVIDELMTNFYGAAAEPMSRYWHHIDRAWIESHEYAGSGYGYLRIFTPEILAEARQLMDQALTACVTAAEQRRVQLANESLILLELFMKLRRDLAAGRLKDLAREADIWRGYAEQLARNYKDQYCFGSHRWYSTWPVAYFNAFFGRPYDDGGRIAADFQLLTATAPLARWSFKTDPDQLGEAAGWQAPDFADSEWGTTDVGSETWSTIGHHSYFGQMWYRCRIDLIRPVDKKIYLWIPSTDGSVKIFVNGRHVPYINAAGEAADSHDGFALPASFEITDQLTADGKGTQITLLCERNFFNEVGTGGLLAPPVVYGER